MKQELDDDAFRAAIAPLADALDAILDASILPELARLPEADSPAVTRMAAMPQLKGTWDDDPFGNVRTLIAQRVAAAEDHLAALVAVLRGEGRGMLYAPTVLCRAALECLALAYWLQAVTCEPSNGSSDQRFILYVADGATYVGDPADPAESERIEWVEVERLRRLIRAGDVPDGLTLIAVLHWLTFG